MRSFPMLLALAAAVVLLGHSASGFYAHSDVVELTPASLKALSSDGGFHLVEVYAPWCGHCKSAAPEVIKAASALKGVATVAGLDGDKHGAESQALGAKGFPTFVFIHGSTRVPFEGERTAKGMIDFVFEQTKKIALSRIGAKKSPPSPSKSSSPPSPARPSDVVALSESDFETLVTDSSDAWMVEFYAPWCGHCKNLAPIWEEVASDLKGKIKFGAVDATVHGALAQRFGVRGYPTIVAFGKDKSVHVVYEGQRTAAAIRDYALELKGGASGPVELTSRDAAADACQDRAICFIVFVPHILDTGAAGRREFLAVLNAAAAKNKKAGFGWLWAEAMSQPALETKLNVGGSGYPAVVAVSAKKGRYSPMRGALSEASLSAFVRSVLAGKEASYEAGAEVLAAVVSVAPWDGKDGEGWKSTDEL